MASPIPDAAKGPGMWRFPDDVLEADDYQKAMGSLLSKIQGDDPIALWENLKLQVKQYTQQYMKFQYKQHKTELGSLQLLLCQVNCRVYAGEDLHKDQFSLQRHISQCEQQLWELPYKNEWITKEGTMHADFLHLEDDIGGGIDIKALLDKHGTIVEGDDVLDVMREFYADLYRNKDVVTKAEIDTFLGKLDFPKLSSKINAGDITEGEVLAVINKLKIGKSLGMDGLNAAFYKKFAEHLAPLLVKCFNKSFITHELSVSQHLAILVLLFKKGDPLLTGNYCPISLTNLDYKILAYVLLARFQPFLNKIIHPAQTAYILGRYIGTNICKVQDVINYVRTSGTEQAVLFLDFCKAFDSVSHIFL